MRTLPSAASRPPPRCWRAWLIQAAPPAIAGQTEAGAAQVGLNPGVRSAGTGACAHHLPHPVRQLDGLLPGKVHPDHGAAAGGADDAGLGNAFHGSPGLRSEEHTSELQSQSNLVCRLLLEKKKKKNK